MGGASNIAAKPKYTLVERSGIKDYPPVEHVFPSHQAQQCVMVVTGGGISGNSLSQQRVLSNVQGI